MFEKNGSYYADWRNAEGQRIRKAFESKRAALRFENEQKAAKGPKTNGAKKPSRPSSRPTSPGADQKVGRARGGQQRKR